jgi:1,4-dihydroxy-2-naphthoate octaprenyltransferase
MHFMTWRKMVKIFSGRALNGILGETSRNMFLMAAFLSLALMLG